MYQQNGKYREALNHRLKMLEDNSSNIHTANFDFMLLSDQDVARICNIISTNQNLTSLSFVESRLNQQNIADLAKALQGKHNITSVTGIVACGDDSDATKKNVLAITEIVKENVTRHTL